MMIIDNKFEIGQPVYIKTDKDQDMGIVTSIEIVPNNLVMYHVSIRSYENNYYDFELSAEKNVLITSSN